MEKKISIEMSCDYEYCDLYIYGETYPIKDIIKELAWKHNYRAHYDYAEKCWIVLGFTADIEKFIRELASQLKPLGYKVYVNGVEAERWVNRIVEELNEFWRNQLRWAEE